MKKVKFIKKLNVAVIFGGRSGEHEVSLASANTIIKNLDKKKYNVIPIGITRQGEWIAGRNSLNLLKTGKISKIIADNYKLQIANYDLLATKKIDVVFPILHGTYGEDGTIQGLFELANLPYVGAGVLGSAVGMDKIIQKKLCQSSGILICDWLWLFKKEWYWLKKNKLVFKRWLTGAEKRLEYPMFVKPSNLGSSVGINKAHNKRELIRFINLAAKYDRKILVEQAVQDAIEIEVSILGNEEPKVSIPGEIISSNEFYDYNAKYVNGKSKIIIPAPLPKNVIRQIQDITIQAFKLLDCAGMARADFFIKKKNNKYIIYFNEINTLPGFTSISMYPKLWEASGISYSKLLDILIKLAIQRHKEKSKLQTSWKTGTDWYK